MAAIVKMKIPKKIAVYFPKNMEMRKARNDAMERMVTINHGRVIFSEKMPDSLLLLLPLFKIKSLLFTTNDSGCHLSNL